MPTKWADIPETVKWNEIPDEMDSGPQIEIDPETIAKKRTSEVFGTIFGLDEPTTIATYDTLAKNMYGENLKPSQVQKMMEEDGFQINADTDEKDVADFSNSMLNRKESPVPAERQRREANRQIYNVFQSLHVADDIIFDPENEWYKTNIATKPRAREGAIYSEPVHETEDLLDFDTYASLLEKSATQENVEDLRRERKALLAQRYNEAFAQTADYHDIQEWSEFSSGSRVGDVTLEAAKGLYTALKTIEKGAWSTSVAMGMAWNQPNLNDIDATLKDAKMTPMKAAGKIGYVARAMSEAIPNFAYNMTVGKAGIFITEYGNARQEALDDGAIDLQAETIALSVATINTIIEGWQIDKIFKIAGLGKGAKQAVKQQIKDRAYKAFLKSGAKFTGQSVAASINEGIEGFAQEGVSIAVPGFIIGNYPKDANGRIDWTGIMSRMSQSFVGEGLGGLLLGTGGAVYNARNVQSYKHDLAFNLIVNEGMESKQALEIATNIVERLRNNEASPKEIYREEVGKVKKTDNRAKAAAHVIKRGKEMPEEQYRQIAMDTTGKDSMVDMNYEEGEKFIDALNRAKVEKVELKEGEVKEDVTEQQIVSEIEEIKQSDEVETPAQAVEKAPSVPVAGQPTGVIKNEAAESGRTGEDLELKPEFAKKYRSVAMLRGNQVIEALPTELNHAAIAERLGFPEGLIPGFIDTKGDFVYQYAEDVPTGETAAEGGVPKPAAKPQAVAKPGEAIEPGAEAITERPVQIGDTFIDGTGTRNYIVAPSVNQETGEQSPNRWIIRREGESESEGLPRQVLPWQTEQQVQPPPAAEAQKAERQAEETISDRLAGKRSGVIGTMIDTKDNRTITLALAPDTSSIGTYSVILKEGGHSQTVRMQYKGRELLSEVMKRFDEYMNIDEPGRFKITINDVIEKPATMVTQKIETFESQKKKELKEYKSKRFKTANDEKQIARIEAQLKENVNKWQVGQGVGLKILGQVNRGLRIIEVLPETHEAVVEYIKDVGILADYEHGKREVVKTIDLIRDKNFDAETKQEALAKGEGEKAEAKELTMSAKQGDLIVPEVVEDKKKPKKDWKKPGIFLRRFVTTVPEFYENPVFVVENGMLVFRDGGTFRVDPVMFGLVSANLQEGQRVRVDLASYDVKAPSAEKVRREKGFGLRGGFLNLTPFGNKGKLQQRVDEVLSLLGKPKKPPVEEQKKSLKELKRTDTLTTFKNVAEDAVKGIDRAFGVMSTRIKNLSQKLFQEVRNKYINPVKMIIADRTQKIHPFVDGIGKLSDADAFDFEVARWTGDIDTVERIIQEQGLQEAYNKYRLVFDLMYHEGKAVGMDMNYMTAYFPSKVKDLDGLLKELNRREEYAPIVTALQEAQGKKGRELTKEEQIQVLDTLLRGYRTTGVSLTPPGFTRVRTLIRDDISLIRFYYGFAETTSRYIESMTENIQARKFFGKQTKEVVQLRANISRQKTNIAKWEKDTTKDRTTNIQNAKDKLRQYETELLTLDDGTLNASIGGYVLDLIVDGTINYDQQVELRQIFEGLFNTVGSNRWVHTLRSLEYVSSLAQVPALVTQYSEVILSILKAPGTTLPNWVRAHLNKSKINLRDIGVAHIGQEWADADLDAAMTNLMKLFEKVDRIGKETFINSVVDKYRKMAKTNPDKVKEELSKYYPEEDHAAIIQSLVSGVVDNNIKGFALNELADVQPISKMEVPELYAKAGNLRVFYMYKTFTLKRLDIMRNQAYNDIKGGIKAGSPREILKGLGKLVWLALMFTLADSSADIVKDVIRGKPIQSLPDYVVDNLLQMILLSKYAANKVRTEGVSALFRDNIALPVSTVDAAARDVSTLMDEDSEKGSELARRIPWIGDLYYWHFGEGSRKVEEGYYD